MYSVYRHYTAKRNAPSATHGLRRRVFSAIAFRRTPVPSADPAGEGRPYQTVLRGDGWHHNALDMRAPNRTRNAPANRNDNIGFRCAKTPRPAVVAVPESLSSTDGGSVRGGV
jgi:formylglycine-generating enzyme required for sulfatase activity